ncbi:MAG: flagellar basal body L-ring protein FlgH [Bacteriovorax sp.]|nr:flagellar basal body L-ring protein FlgH [Bacteriovorax sp.]
MKMKHILLLAVVTVFSSCSSYMNSIYSDFEQQERANNDIDSPNADTFDQYRRPKRRTSAAYNKIDRTVTTGNTKLIAPEVKRQYKGEKETAKRYTASDLTDNGNDGSLWAGSDPNAFLFSNSKNKTSGDIIQINVLPRLKNEITMELKKAFPDNPFESKAMADAKAEETKPGASPTEAKPADKKEPAVAESTGGEGAQDKISGVVVEEINREHLLIKGRKNVLYKNRKRMVEVQALVSRKDIGDNDTINSDAILESNVAVVR